MPLVIADAGWHTLQFQVWIRKWVARFMTMNYVKPERLSLRLHPELNEKWVQERIAADPSILGLGDLVLRDKERMQPRAGRLDLLLQDLETKHRYEVELLGRD
jgi:hypothetical protein